MTHDDEVTPQMVLTCITSNADGARGRQVRYGWIGRVYSRRMLLPRREMSAP